MAKRRLFCKTCSGLLICWGKIKTGEQRYRCANCSTTRKHHLNKTSNKEIIFSLFRQYILWGVTYQMLSSLSGYSIRFLEGKFHAYLEQNPPELPPIVQPPYKEAYLLIDCLWFGRWFVLVVYRQSGNLTIIHL